MTLIGTASTNVIACGETLIPPTPDTRSDLSTIITTSNLDKIYVGQLEKPNKKQILDSIKTKNPSANNSVTNIF